MDTQESVAAITSLPPDVALIKVENETLMAAASARPRDLEKISAGLTAQVKAFPAFAAKVIYCRPVGKDDKGQPVFATGLSIRAAEAIAEAYGFNRIASEISLLPDGNARVTASFTDFQRCRVISASVLVSRTYKGRDGKMRTHAEDRFTDLVCKAVQSKTIRDTILRSVAPSLKAELEFAANSATKLDDGKVAKIADAFAEYGVKIEQIEVLLNTPRAAWGDDHRTRLLQLYNAIEDGETTVEDLFGAKSAKTAEAPSVAPTLKEQQAESVADALGAPKEVATSEAPKPAPGSAPIGKGQLAALNGLVTQGKVQLDDLAARCAAFGKKTLRELTIDEAAAIQRALTTTSKAPNGPTNPD